jgi:hypothetical protein
LARRPEETGIVPSRARPGPRRTGSRRDGRIHAPDHHGDLVRLRPGPRAWAASSPARRWGPAWPEYMDAVHRDLPETGVQASKDRPRTHGVRVRGPAHRRLPRRRTPLPRGYCPATLCTVHFYQERQRDLVIDRAGRSPLSADLRSKSERLPESFLDEEDPGAAETPAHEPPGTRSAVASERYSETTPG